MFFNRVPDDYDAMGKITEQVLLSHRLIDWTSRFSNIAKVKQVDNEKQTLGNDNLVHNIWFRAKRGLLFRELNVKLMDKQGIH